MTNKLVYFDRREYGYTEINESYAEDPNKLVEYFGNIDDHLDINNEFIIYELVPYRILKKEIEFKFK